MTKQIVIPHGELSKLAQEAEVSRQTARYALRGFLNTPKAKTVRDLAIKKHNGGFVYKTK